jgi:uncharacterized protein YqgQ
MIEITKNYRLTLSEEEVRNLYDLLQCEKDHGQLNLRSGRYFELGKLYYELHTLFKQEHNDY